MSRRAGIIYILAVIVLGAIFLVPGDKEGDSSTSPSVPLDYSKPIFTTSITVVCPVSLLSDVRADHSPEKVADMFNSVFSRSEKAKSLGCQELQQGILVSTSPLAVDFVNVGLPGNLGPKWFTLAGELTNKVPGQSDVERRELPDPRIERTTNGPAKIPMTSSPSAGHLLVSMPSRLPIPKGDGVAASTDGSGALICPDEGRMAAVTDMMLDTSGKQTPSDKANKYGIFECNYVPPGTEMISLGPNEHGSLAIVSAKLADGTLIQGVTFPNMFIKSLMPHEERAGE